MKMLKDNDWCYFYSDSKCDYKITGKYLFFSANVNKLIDIIWNEFMNYNFHHAKINLELRMNHKEYVLCLYYKDDSRADELYKRNEDEYNVKYRFWKSDEDTLAGRYSKKFLENGGYAI